MIMAIEVKVKSCRGLKAFNFFQKLSVYAVVSVVSVDPETKRKTVHAHRKTPIDREGDGNPEWNHQILFDLKDYSTNLDLFLEFQMLCEVMVFADKTIGEVRVPIRDLVEESRGRGGGGGGGGGGGCLRFMSYQIRSGNGKPNGVLDFSYKVDIHDDDEKNEKKKIVYPKIESSTEFEASLYPSLSKIEAWCPELEYPPPPPPPPPPPLQPPGIHYPPREQIHYELAPCGLFGSDSGSGRGLHHDHNWMSATAYPTKNDYFSEFGSWQHNRGYYHIAGPGYGERLVITSVSKINVFP